MADEQLVIYSDEQLGDLAGLIQGLGLAGEMFEYFGETHYRPGPCFDEHITVDSSHRVVVLDDPGVPRIGPSRDHIHLSAETGDELEFVGSALTEAPACACGREVTDWPDRVGAWYEARGTQFLCAGCGAQNAIPKLDWHRRAGFARSVIRVWGVRPDEMRPQRGFLTVLGLRSSANWEFMYYRL